MASGSKSWNSISPSRTLTAGIGTGDTSLALSGSTTDYPAVPFSARLTDANDETVYEVVLCTAKSGTTATVTRGYDGTTARSFLSGALFEHTVIGEDLNDIPYPDQTNTWSGVQTFSALPVFSHASGLQTNTISERTAAAGVTADGVLLKDSAVTAGGGVTVNGATLTGDGSGALYFAGNLLLTANAGTFRAGTNSLLIQTTDAVSRIGISAGGNVNLSTVISDPASAAGVILIGNTAAEPSANPSGGGALWCNGGALKYRGSSGTVTTIAPA